MLSWSGLPSAVHLTALAFSLIPGALLRPENKHGLPGQPGRHQGEQVLRQQHCAKELGKDAFALRSRCSKYRCDEKKNQIFVGTIFASAFFFEIAFDGATKSLWENANKGVCLAGKKKKITIIL